MVICGGVVSDQPARWCVMLLLLGVSASWWWCSGVSDGQLRWCIMSAYLVVVVVALISKLVGLHIGGAGDWRGSVTGGDEGTNTINRRS